MSRPIHFEIHATDPQRCIDFYTKMFGWTFTKWDSPMDYWLIKTGEKDTPGIDGGMLLAAARAAHGVLTVGERDVANRQRSLREKH